MNTLAYLITLSPYQYSYLAITNASSIQGSISRAQYFQIALPLGTAEVLKVRRAAVRESFAQVFSKH